MSADLLAEFDSFYQAPQTAKQHASNTSALNDLSFLGPTAQAGGASGDNDGSQWQTPQPKPNEDIWGNMSAFQPSNARQPPPKDDIWGDFESSFSPPVPDTNHNVPIAYGTSTIVTVSERAKPSVIRRDTLEMFSSKNIEGWGTPAAAQSFGMQGDAQRRTAVPASKSSNNDILFDADNLSDDEEDFGDFEAAPADVAPEPKPVPVQPLKGLFGATTAEPRTTKRPAQLSPIASDFEHGVLPYPQAPRSPSFQERNPFADLGVATTQVQKIKSETREGSPVTPWPSFQPPQPTPYQDSPAVKDDLDDDWGEFTDMPPVVPVPITKSKPGIEADAWAWDAADGIVEKKSKETDVPPPTNVPPPSVLLPLLGSLFDLPQTALFKPVANQPFPLKNRILSDPSAVAFLRGYLLIATVAARVLAGRKQRWKRDTILSQAMKIGPAAAGGKGGMKLAGVDKAEVAREDREVADIVRVWKDQLGRLKSAVAVANSSISETSEHLVIPEVSETMQVKVQEGAMTAPKQCVVCGLKREERVGMVDLNVEDSFGEWWTEYWGHRACRNFWLEHEPKLRNR